MKHVYRLTLGALLVSAGLLGQALTSLSGVVTDPTGAVIPNAAVILENLERGTKRETTSDVAGRYAFVQVQPDVYRITARAAGFADVVIERVELLVNTPATVNIRFEKVGAVAETISISAEGVQVNTVDASLGHALGGAAVTQLPMNARNVVSLLALQPGVVFIGEFNTDDRNGAVNGGKSDQANVTLDGVDVNDQQYRYAFTSVLRVTLDSVQEFRVTTLNATADQGRTSGAQVALVTKNGTNELHGSLYEYHRNTVTTANDFFLNAAGVERPKLIRNIFGGSIGGPIKKNRLFYFGNFEGRRDARDGQAVRYVPSRLMRQGILQYQRADGSIAQVTPADIRARLDPNGPNPAALQLLQTYPEPNDTSVGDNLNIMGFRFKAPTPLRWNTYIARFDYTLDSQARHTLFARGNLQNDRSLSLPQFPGEQPNSVNLNNSKGMAVGLTSVLRPNWVSNFRFGFTRQGFEDTGIGHFRSVTFRGLDSRYGLTKGFAANVPVYSVSEDMSWIRGGHTIQYGFVARLIRQNRVNYANSFSSAVTNASWLIDSGAELNRPFADMAPTFRVAFRDAATAVLGLVTQGNARYNFLVDGTRLNEGDPIRRTFAGEEYELYIQDSWRVTRSLTLTAGLRWSLMPPIYEANGQQISPDIPIGDWFNRRGGLAEQGRSNLEAGLISYVVSSSPQGRPLYPYHKKNFAPRFAIAYSPQAASGIGKFFFGGPGRTSIRAGWGMFYDLFGSGIIRTYDATAFGLSTSLTNPSAVVTLVTAPRFTGFQNVPESLLPAPPKGGFPATYPNLFAITNGLDDTLVPPYSMNLNFSIGREFGSGWFIQGSYVGRLSRRSLARSDVATPTNLKDPRSGQTYFQAAQILARLAMADTPVADVRPIPFWENLWAGAAAGGLTATQVVYNRYYVNAPDWTFALYQLDTGAGQGNCAARNRCSILGPWAMFHPQYSYLSVFRSIAGGNYHGMQWNVRKRFVSGDFLDFNYTWSKSIDLRSSTERAGTNTGVIINPWFPGQYKAVSDYDVTHSVSAGFVYNLPFGRGQRFGSTAGRALDLLIGGWQLSGLYRHTTGFPTSVGNGRFWPTNWNLTGWATQVGPVSTKTTKNAPAVAGAGGPNLFADPRVAIKAYDYTLPGEIGQRNGLRGDGYFGIDAGLSKRFVLPYADGKHSLQFRWETFNVTNSVRFDVNSLSLDLGNTGTFGKYGDTLTSSRVMQFGLRYEF